MRLVMLNSLAQEMGYRADEIRKDISQPLALEGLWCRVVTADPARITSGCHLGALLFIALLLRPKGPMSYPCLAKAVPKSCQDGPRRKFSRVLPTGSVSWVCSLDQGFPRHLGGCGLMPTPQWTHLDLAVVAWETVSMASFGATEPPSLPLAVPLVSHRETAAAIYTE